MKTLRKGGYVTIYYGKGIEMASIAGAAGQQHCGVVDEQQPVAGEYLLWATFLQVPNMVYAFRGAVFIACLKRTIKDSQYDVC